MRKDNTGFTLIEIMLSIALLAIIFSFSVNVYRDAPVRNDLSISTAAVAEYGNRAKAYAMSGYFDSSWGIYIEDSGVTLFKGDSYVTRDTDFDEQYAFFNTEISGNQEFVFEKVRGTPNQAGNVTIASSILTAEHTVTINEKGLVIID